MKVRVGLTTSNLTSLLHHKVTVACSGGLQVASADPTATLAKPAAEITVEARQGVLHVLPPLVFALAPNQRLHINAQSGAIAISSLNRQHGTASSAPHYLGSLELIAEGDRVRVILVCDLEDYLRGVLQSEMPASYHLEAIKCQAVAARTYALKPRINHTKDNCTVCDSFLCCQYFAGRQTVAPRCEEAIDATRGEVLTYQDEPILALFSSCAGAHTESYESCFSDPETGAFPPPPRPYLVSVSESKFSEITNPPVTENELRTIWKTADYRSADAWSPHFRWHVVLPASSLEGHMHHQIETMLKDADTKPFISGPGSGQFGHIENFQVVQRGPAGTAIALKIATSKGEWTIKKELPIRSVFANPEVKLKRLSSARLFFDIEKDKLGLIDKVKVCGLGWGHGVGMQQTGAQGWSLQGKTYREILAHYFRQSQISKQS